jgi:hypothetical protein
MMKKLIYIFPVLLFSLAAIFGCDDMNAIHEKYLQGETIYAGKLNMLSTQTGFNRIRIEGSTEYLGNSVKATVKYEGQEQVFDVATDDDYVQMVVENLEERDYEFEIYTEDEAGNKSIKQLCTGSAVGDKFIENQLPRSMVEFVFDQLDLSLRWAEVSDAEYISRTEVTYENNSGTTSSVTVLPGETITKLEDWKPAGEISYQSFVKAGANGFEEAALEAETMTLPDLPPVQLDKSLHALVNMPTDNRGDQYGARPWDYLFDGDDSWRNSDQYGYHSGGNSLPSYFTIDLGVTAQLRKCAMGLRDPNNYNGNNPTHIEIWGIDDITGAETPDKSEEQFIEKGWKLIYKGDVDGKYNQKLDFEIDSEEDVRYIRLKTVTAVNNDGVQYTELTFWGKNVQTVAE